MSSASSSSPAATPQPFAQALELVQHLQRRWQARCIETHISWVLVDGRHAWKFKKPIRLPFVDFTDLATRRHLCEQELRLNRRLAPDLYDKVIAVCGTPDAPEIDGQGAPIEYAVQMKAFAADALASHQVHTGGLTARHIDRLAVQLSAFHRRAARAEPADGWGTPERILAPVRGLVAGLRAQPRMAAQGQALDRLSTWVDAEAARLAPVWLQRLAQGRVVEGHGDLHLANVIVQGEEATAFDCIEFDPALRWIDALNDLAFLLMDLMAHGREDLAWRALSCYLDDSGDHAGLPTLRFYLVGRALVRAMVAGLPGAQDAAARADAVPEGACAHRPPDYLALALRLIEAPPPALLITHGVSGSGKSWQSQQLLERSAAIRVRSDVERRRLVQAAPSPAAARYSQALTTATYERLLALADVALGAGWRVIVDATFLRRADRQSFAELAAQHAVPCHVLHCQAPDDELVQRIRLRRAAAEDPSEADEAVLAAQQAAAEPLDDAEAAAVIRLDDTQPDPIGHLRTQWLGALA
ncbi:MAG: AAA family ATPase [Aquabacterium sp.]